MIFIITGPDGSGKTMLAQKMARQSKGIIVPFSYPRTKEEKEHQYSAYQNILQRAGESDHPWYLEHAWYSEMAYGPVKRKKSYIDWPHMYMLEKEVARFGGGCVIYCTGVVHQMYKRAQMRGEKYITNPDDYVEICKNFDLIMNAPHHIPVFKYVYSEM